MPDNFARIFFGFALPRDVSARVEGLRTLVNDPKETVRWVKGKNIHLTIRFIGETPLSAIPKMVSAVRTKLGAIEEADIVVTGTGCFPKPARPRILWVGVQGETEKLTAIESVIHSAVEPLGFPREEREFIPHITIGRVRYPLKVTPDVGMFMNSNFTEVPCHLRELILFESRMSSRGPQFIPLERFELLPRSSAK